MTQRAFAGIAVAAVFVAGSAFAEGPYQAFSESMQAPTGATGFPVGPLSVIPGIDLAQGYNDNLHLTDRGTKSSAFTRVSPWLRAEARSGANRYDATLRLDHGSYWNSSNDNYTNYSLTGNGDFVFDGRTGLKLTALYRHAMNPVGTTDRPSLNKDPDQYNDFGLDGVFRYGAPGAQGRIEIDAGALAHRYTNNRSTTDGYDTNTWKVGGAFFWRVMPRTEVLLQARHVDTHYTDSANPTSPSLVVAPKQSSGQNYYYLGLKWEATAKTTGTLKLGYLTQNFDSSAYKDYGNFAWEAGVRWSPLTYSVFDFTTGRRANDASGVGSSIISSYYNLTWNHAWNSRFSTQALADYRRDNFLNTDPFPDRLDKSTTFGARATYSFRRWLLLGAEASHSNRNSEQGIYDYKRNLFQLTVGATL